MKKAEYGIDAPGVIRNLVIFSIIGLVLPVIFPIIKIGQVYIRVSGFIWMDVPCGLMAVWMLLYSIYGKRRRRDRMLNMMDWKGNEMVLDVGTGRGLLIGGVSCEIKQ
ncbi:MAG: hypothetical protein ABJB16_08310 [Saprospiraceae bacterium]